MAADKPCYRYNCIHASVTEALLLFFQRHGITEVFWGVGDPAAVEANGLRLGRKPLDLLKPFRAGQHTQLPLM